MIPYHLQPSWFQNGIFFFAVFVGNSILSFSRVGELCLPQCPAPGVTARQRRPRPLLQTRSVSSGRGRPRGHPRWPPPQQTNHHRHSKVIIFSHYLLMKCLLVWGVHRQQQKNLIYKIICESFFVTFDAESKTFCPFQLWSLLLVWHKGEAFYFQLFELSPWSKSPKLDEVEGSMAVL